MDRARLSSTSVNYERDGRAHLILAAPDGAQMLAVQTEDADGTIRTIKHIDFGVASGAVVNLDSFATIGDKILVGRDAWSADGTETDAAFRSGYGVIDFHEGAPVGGPVGSALGDFTVSNDVRVDGDVHAAAFISLSDARAKRDIRSVTEPECARVHELRPVTYTMRATGHESAGFIAQELEGVYPRAVRDTHGTKTVDYQQVLTMLVAEVQRLARRLMLLEPAPVPLNGLTGLPAHGDL